MPPSADPQAEVVETILALERSCLEADAALVERRWAEFGAAMTAQSTLTDKLAYLFEAAPQHGPDDDLRVRKRLEGILAYRDDQLRRLRAYHEEVGERLRSISKVRAFSRSVGTAPVPARFLNVEH
jgi:hypothetical protein